jgi:anti-anti-sigma regulatory factor
MVEAVSPDTLSPTFGSAPTFSGFEVATLTADTLRANVRVTGDLALNSVALLTSVLRTHVGAGRRYLRVDLTGVRLLDVAVIDSLVEVNDTVVELGGMLIFDNAGPRILDALRGTSLYAHACRS